MLGGFDALRRSYLAGSGSTGVDRWYLAGSGSTGVDRWYLAGSAQPALGGQRLNQH